VGVIRIGFDEPETHVVPTVRAQLLSFYAKQWQGVVD